MAKQRPPEYVVTDNYYGTMFFGPGGPKDADDLTEFRFAVASNSTYKYTSNGAKVEHIQGPYYITCGHNLKRDRKTGSSEDIAYAIEAETGDLIFNSPTGNIKFLCKNMYIETRGEKKTNGVFMLSSNGAVVINSGQQLTLSGTKVCVRGEAEVNIVSSHFINLVGEIQKGGSPISSILSSIGLSQFADLVKGVEQGCR